MLRINMVAKGAKKVKREKLKGKGWKSFSLRPLGYGPTQPQAFRRTRRKKGKGEA